MLIRAARAIPQSVITGLQAGLGLVLGTAALSLMGQNWTLALPALALLGCSLIWRRGPWTLVVIGVSLLFFPATHPATDAIPEASREGVDISATVSGILAQLPLTLLNAVALTAAVARDLFPNARKTVGERKLAVTSGLLNLAFVPFGAMPMCHGAGGVAAHHRFGALGMGAPLILAALCLGGAAMGPQVIGILSAIPLPVVGALLVYAALDLILSRRVLDARRDCQPVIAVTAVGTFAGGALAGLILGLAAEVVRSHIVGKSSNDADKTTRNAR